MESGENGLKNSQILKKKQTPSTASTTANTEMMQTVRMWESLNSTSLPLKGRSRSTLLVPGIAVDEKDLIRYSVN